MRHADGSWRYIEVVGTNLLDDPSVDGIVANYRDITQRKRAEDRTLIFATLGQRLSVATTAISAVRIIANVADKLLTWDAFSLLVRSPEDGLLHAVLNYDIQGGAARRMCAR